MTTAAELEPDRRQNKGSVSAQILPSRGASWVDHRKPKAKTLSRAERDARKLSEVIEILSEFTDAKVLADLYARGEEATGPDGFPSLSGGGSDIHGGRGGDPTERVVELRAGGRDDESDTWKELRDTILVRIVEFQGEVTSIHGSARLLRKCADITLHAADNLRGRVSAVGECVRCTRPVSGVGSDRLRAGLCPSCANAYYESRRDKETVPDWLMRLSAEGRRFAPVAGSDEIPLGMTYNA